MRNQLRKAEADLPQAQANMMKREAHLDRDERLYAQHVIAAKVRDDAHHRRPSRTRPSVASNKANVDSLRRSTQ